MDIMEMKELLQNATEEMIAYSQKTSAPIEDVICNSRAGEAGEPIEVMVLFAEIEQLQKMEEDKLKDSFMSVFIKYLTANNFPFDGQPQMKFQFSISI